MITMFSKTSNMYCIMHHLKDYRYYSLISYLIYGFKMFLRLPECYCSVSGKEIPRNLPPEQVPQMIMISFDDAVNTNIYEEIERFLGSGLKNPNGCDIKTTFFCLPPIQQLQHGSGIK